MAAYKLEWCSKDNVYITTSTKDPLIIGYKVLSLDLDVDGVLVKRIYIFKNIYTNDFVYGYLKKRGYVLDRTRNVWVVPSTADIK